ncbi:MAG: hypothetical protein QXU32_06305 [Nitrososphaerales archaeon]
MSDYSLLYPKTVGLMKGLVDLIRSEDVNKESLNLVVKKNTEDIVRILISEGFHKLKFCENKKPMQIGNGFTKMLDRTWEIHVRLIEMKEGLVAIQGEIEISRRYIQHIVSNRAPAIYEIANILKKNGIDYNIWNSKINDYVSSILDNHHIKLKGIPFLIPWIPACIIGPSVGLWFLLRFLGLFQ